MDVNGTQLRPTQLALDSFGRPVSLESGQRSRSFPSNHHNSQGRLTLEGQPEDERVESAAFGTKYNQYPDRYTSMSRHQRYSSEVSSSGAPRTVNMVKTASGFGFTLADTGSGQMVRSVSDAFGGSRLRPGDVIVAIGDSDVSREPHANVVSMLKSIPAGSTTRISFIRSDGERPARRSRSVFPETLRQGPLSSPSFASSSSSFKVQGKAQSHPSYLQRSTSLNPEAVLYEEHLNGRTHPPETTWSTSRRSAPPPVQPRSSSLNYTPDLSNIHPMEVDSRGDGRQQSTLNRANEELRNTLAQRETLPAYELQKQYWTSLSAVSSPVNFSGTPDYIPASVYSPPILEENIDPRTLFSLEGSHFVDNPETINEKFGEMHLKNNNFSDFSSRNLGNLEHSNNVSERSNAYSKSQNDERQQQGPIGSLDRRISGRHQEPLYATVNRTPHNSRKHIHGGERADQKVSQSFQSPPSQVNHKSYTFELEIHRGSRGFGFSIRGGKEFHGMPLLVLNIASGGPADMDGRMKNGDQILSINGVSTEEMTHETAIELIQNAASPISLTVKRTPTVNGKPR